MIHSYTRERDKSDTKWHRELIACSEKSEHHEWYGHNDRVEYHEWLRKTMKLKCEYSKYNNKSDKKC
jgi:hypothetical protein